MQISADEKLMHCRFVLHSRSVLRGVHGDDKKKKCIIIIWPNVRRETLLSCCSAKWRHSGYPNALQHWINRVTDV